MLCAVVGKRNSVGASTDSINAHSSTHTFNSVPTRQILTSLLVRPEAETAVVVQRQENSSGAISAPDIETNNNTRTKKTGPDYSNSTCTVRPSEGSRLPEQIRHLIDVEEVKLIEYNLIFPRYNASPLASNSTVYRAESWSRVSSRHGQTLLSLSFNYGILSMMTLAVGTASIEVPLEDDPHGCLGGLSDGDQLDLLMNLMLRDFRDVIVEDDGAATAAAAAAATVVKGEERICHEAIQNDDGYAKFVDMCCYASPDKRTPTTITCEPDLVNVWLRLIQLSLSLIRLGLLFFGPLLLASTVLSATRKKYPYAVKLKEPLTKTAVFRHRTDAGLHDANGVPVSAKHHIDLKLADGYPKLKLSLSDVQLGVPVPIRISQYDVLVAYGRTLTENRVPVGFWRNIFDALFLCRLRNVGPFRDCCAADMLSTVGRWLPRRPTPRRWISFWSRVGLILMVLLIPSPYYLRLFVFYRFEYDEVAVRKEAIARSGLRERFAGNPLHYFTPTHPVFVFVYVTYFFTVAFIGLTARRDKEGPIVRILVGAFDDLASLPWPTVLHVMVGNLIWPFQQFGLAGCAAALVYWPVAIPLTVVTNAIYCLPTVYLTVRMVFYSHNSFLFRTKRRFAVRPYRARRQPDNTIKLFDVEAILRRFQCACVVDQTAPNDLDPNDLDIVPSASASAARRASSETVSIASSDKIGLKKSFRSCCTHFLASLLCVACLYSVLIVLSECIGCLVEVGFFTLMGVIVNAGALLKYVALVILLFAYSQDCFSNVQKTYLKLNKSLFGEVKGRVKDFENVTSQPSHLQENQGFKSQEQSEQAFYEAPDDLTDAPPGHWMINDLVLFVDNEDTPRIPKKLFDEVCQIKVAGVPGPVYRGQLIALKRFMKIVVFVAFVFIVVLSFSDAYRISSTNQMLATLAGGFLPLILRTLMGRDEAELELGTLSFKSKLDEVIKNYHQVWPIYDFPFQLAPTPQEPASAANGESPDVVDVSGETVKLAGSEEPAGCNSPDVLGAASYDRQVSYSSREGVVGRAKSEREFTTTERQQSFVEHGRPKVTFQDEGSIKVDLLIDLPETEGWSDLEITQMLV